jgi:hypothetical protein
MLMCLVQKSKKDPGVGIGIIAVVSEAAVKK